MTSSKIVIVGVGFAGVWSALAAKRLLKMRNKDSEVEIVVVSPHPRLVIRPRLYEANPASMYHDMTRLFKAADIRFVQGEVETISPESHSLTVRTPSGQSELTYSRLVLAAGSQVIRPKGVTGLGEHAFDVDTIEAADRLDDHLDSLSTIPQSAARDTFIVCGCGFTGIEIATELPRRLKGIRKPRIVLVEGADEVGPELGSGPRPVIKQALQKLGIEVKLGQRVAAVGAAGVTLESGEYIETLTAIWTAGMRASPLTEQIPGEKDALARLLVDQQLRVPSSEHVFATGDAAHAATDNKGHVALMSCQHAMSLGRAAGHNAAADLLGDQAVLYSQPGYNTCLDLGGWGAVVSSGWERTVIGQGEKAKKLKMLINGSLIYPPDDLDEALKQAEFVPADFDGFFRQQVTASL